jgi:hypothetical protein
VFELNFSISILWSRGSLQRLLCRLILLVSVVAFVREPLVGVVGVGTLCAGDMPKEGRFGRVWGLERDQARATGSRRYGVSIPRDLHRPQEPAPDLAFVGMVRAGGHMCKRSKVDRRVLGGNRREIETPDWEAEGVRAEPNRSLSSSFVSSSARSVGTESSRCDPACH